MDIYAHVYTSLQIINKNHSGMKMSEYPSAWIKAEMQGQMKYYNSNSNFEEYKYSVKNEIVCYTQLWGILSHAGCLRSPLTLACALTCLPGRPVPCFSQAQMWLLVCSQFSLLVLLEGVYFLDLSLLTKVPTESPLVMSHIPCQGHFHLCLSWTYLHMFR